MLGYLSPVLNDIYPWNPAKRMLIGIVPASARAVELDSESYLARVIHQEILYFSGKLEESAAAGQLALAISGRHPWSMVFLALTFSQAGKAAEADAVYQEMLGRAGHQYLSHALLALAAAAASREDEVIRHGQSEISPRLSQNRRRGISATRQLQYLECAMSVLKDIIPEILPRYAAIEIASDHFHCLRRRVTS